MVKAPSSLSASSKKLWTQIITEFAIDDSHALEILATALGARDRAEAAREVIDREGMVTYDRFKQARPHVLLSVERDNRSLFLAGIKQLGLDMIPLEPRSGRPSGSGGKR